MLHLLMAHPATSAPALRTLTHRTVKDADTKLTPSVCILLGRRDLPEDCTTQLLSAVTGSHITTNPDALTTLPLEKFLPGLWELLPADHSAYARALLTRSDADNIQPTMWVDILTGWNLDTATTHLVAQQIPPHTYDVPFLLQAVALAADNPSTRDTFLRYTPPSNAPERSWMLHKLVTLLLSPPLPLQDAIDTLATNPEDLDICTVLVHARDHIPTLAHHFATQPTVATRTALLLATHPAVAPADARALLRHACTSWDRSRTFYTWTAFERALDSTVHLILDPACDPDTVIAHQTLAWGEHTNQLLQHPHPGVVAAALNDHPRGLTAGLAAHPQVPASDRAAALEDVLRSIGPYHRDQDTNDLVAVSEALPDIDAAAARIRPQRRSLTQPHWSDLLTRAWLDRHWASLNDDEQLAVIDLLNTGADLTLPDLLHNARALYV